jgi:hypothetical protein
VQPPSKRLVYAIQLTQPLLLVARVEGGGVICYISRHAQASHQ